MNYYAVLDVGGSAIKYALMNESGEFLEKSSIPTPKENLELFLENVEFIVKEYEKKYVLKGIAISMPGAVNIESGYIAGISALPYIHGPNMKELLQERTCLKVEMENDANCAALAEGWLGAAKNVMDYICIVIGTGIGGAIVLNKKIRHGKNQFCGEFGYMMMEDYLEKPKGESWSTLAAVGGLLNNVAKRKGIDPESLNGKKVFELAENGDEEVKEEIEKFMKRLVVGIYNLQYIIDPEKILIGGAISSREGFIERLNDMLSQLKIDKNDITINVEKCQYGNDSNLIGALYHFLQRQSVDDNQIRLASHQN